MHNIPHFILPPENEIYFTNLHVNSGLPCSRLPSAMATGQNLNHLLRRHRNRGATMCFGAMVRINSSVSMSSGMSSSSMSMRRLAVAAGRSTKHCTIRGQFDFNYLDEPLDVDQVESAADIVKRFVTG